MKGYKMPEKFGLTERQRELLDFIKAYMSDHNGLAPSFGDMSKHLGLVSKSGPHRLIAGLIERGHIRAIRGRARSIQVVE